MLICNKLFKGASVLYTQVDPGRTGQRGERTEMDQELLKEGASVMGVS